jgi:serine/threonine-protein kinase
MEGDEISGWKPGKPYVFLKTPAAEALPYFSPDGRWLAYQSNESGRMEVYVRPFPLREGKWLVSSGGGQGPTWSRAKRELLYVTPDNLIRVVPYTVQADSFRSDPPRPWTARQILPLRFRSIDLHPDGERVAAALATEGQANHRRDKVVFIFNFFDELRRLAPTVR